MAENTVLIEEVTGSPEKQPIRPGFSEKCLLLKSIDISADNTVGYKKKDFHQLWCASAGRGD